MKLFVFSSHQMMFLQNKTQVTMWTVVVVLLLICSCLKVESKCKKGCPLALASYCVSQGTNITFIAQVLGSTDDIVLSYNLVVPDVSRVQTYSRVNVPFSCDCINGTFLGHIFSYRAIKGDTYDIIAQIYYANLTTVSLLQQFNSYNNPNDIPLNALVSVPVKCYCGDSDISEDYGLFLTYPLRSDDNLTYINQMTNSTASLLQMYNPNVNVMAGSGILFIPVTDKTGEYPRLPPSSGLSRGAIAGVSVAVASGLIMVAVVYCLHHRRKKMKIASLVLNKPAASATGNIGVTVDKSVRFSYKELAQATNNFSLAYKIGSGGFGDVYYAELRGQKAAIKKMDMKSSKEFHAELKVLTHVHHLNLVGLIGYCVKEYYFLVYEYIENGNLSEHLLDYGKEPLPWSTRLQIALDSARGLEYIHEHTIPTYIHRDIKSANILIDKNFRAKVADFGLTKLFGKFSAAKGLVGTFGYMPPEYGYHGEVTPKVDVYAFGVVLYELISAKAAVVKKIDSSGEAKGLARLFESILEMHDTNEVRLLVDARLGNDYPFSTVYKMAQLAKACTHENPELRPSMRSVVVSLVAMSSTSADWNAGAFSDDQGLETNA